MKPIAIYGAGSFGKEVLMLIRQINDIQQKWNPIGFFDDNLNPEDSIYGLPVLGDKDILNNWAEPLFIIVAIGNPVVRKRIVNKLTNDYIAYATLIHPSVQLEPYQHCFVGEGSVIAAGNILTVDINIGRHVILNMACTCGHDVEIKDYVSIMPNCIISGEAEIGEGSFISAGAAIMNRVVLETNSRIPPREVVINGVSKMVG